MATAGGRLSGAGWLICMQRTVSQAGGDLVPRSADHSKKDREGKT